MSQPTPSTPVLRNRLRPFLVLGVVAFIITQIVALSPSQLERSRLDSDAIDPQTLVEDEGKQVTLADGIPKGIIPEYTVDGFNYVSTFGGQKQWKLLARKAFLYDKAELVHARTVKAFIYDANGDITVITGKEAKYATNGRDLEIYGAVRAILPDGFEIRSEYMKHEPAKDKIFIPTKYAVAGEPTTDPEVLKTLTAPPDPMSSRISFTSNGLDFDKSTKPKPVPAGSKAKPKDKPRPKIILPANVKLTLHEPSKKGEENAAVTSTVVESDYCVIDREVQIANFTMYPNRALKDRFIRITQPSMFARSRRGELRYGTTEGMLNYMTAYEDVLLKERNKDPESLRYATAGRADFDSKRNVIILTQFPQVYQNKDTVTGDVITMHRDSDIVEVDHSNSFSTGEPQ